MTAWSYHHHNGRIVMEGRDGQDDHRSTFDLAGAKALNAQLSTAITAAEDYKAPTEGPADGDPSHH